MSGYASGTEVSAERSKAGTEVVVTGLSSYEVCRRTGATYRQLDYWDRSGLLSPSLAPARGSGTQRRYSEADVAKAAIVRYLMAQRSREQWAFRTHHTMRNLPELGGGGRWLVVGVDGGAGVAHDGELERACAHFGPGAMVIDLEALVPAQTAPEQEAS